MFFREITMNETIAKRVKNNPKYILDTMLTLKGSGSYSTRISSKNDISYEIKDRFEEISLYFQEVLTYFINKFLY